MSPQHKVMGNPIINIHREPGSRQLIVQHGGKEYFFLDEAEAERFARQLACKPTIGSAIPTDLAPGGSEGIAQKVRSLLGLS